MKVSSFETIALALNDAEVRYLVAGGLAVNAHGHLRLTNDVDLVVKLDRANVRAAWSVLEDLGYRPTVPVRVDEFADSATRERWIREKGMQVLPFWSDRHRETPVNVFAAEPFDFDAEYAKAYSAELSPDFSVRLVRIETLMRMKQKAGRPMDMDDVQHLRWILEDRER